MKSWTQHLIKPFISSSAQSGFSVIEVLMASVVVSVAALGISSAIVHLSKSKNKSAAVSMGIGIESALVSALEDEGTYANYKSSLSIGKVPSNMVIQVGGSKPFSIKPGQTLFFDSNQNPCSGFTQNGCMISVTLSPMTAVGAGFGFAYTIQMNSNIGTLAPIGAPSAKFTTGDFTVGVPKEAYANVVMDCNPDYIPGEPSTQPAVGLMGFDKATAQPFCLYKNTKTCAPGTIPKGYQVLFEPSDNSYHVELKCTGIFQTLACPNNYSVMQFNPKTLEPGSIDIGQCIYAATKTGKYPSDTAPKTFTDNGSGGISVQSCPETYKVDPTQTSCTLQPGSIVGTYAGCTSAYVLQTLKKDMGTYDLYTYSYILGAGTQEFTISPVRPTTTIVSYSSDGRTVTCQTLVPKQICCTTGTKECTTANARVNLKYTCVLDTTRFPETVGAQ